jgi:hypothetical protein
VWFHTLGWLGKAMKLKFSLIRVSPNTSSRKFAAITGLDKEDNQNGKRTYQCPVCGYKFTLKETEACQVCPFKKRCPLVMCPRCYYELPKI